MSNTLQLSDTFTAKFPVFSLAYHSRSGTLIVGGGGGPSRSGVPNGLLLLRLVPAATCKSKFALQAQDELRTGDEAVMCLSLYDDKTSEDCLLVAGVNDRCWLLEYSPDATSASLLISNTPGNRISSLAKSLNSNAQASSSSSKPFNLLRTMQSDASPNDDGYLRVTRFISEGRSVLAAGSDGSVREWTVPEMRLVNKVEDDAATERGEIIDADGSEELLVFVASSGAIHLCPRKSASSVLNKDSRDSFTFKFVRLLNVDGKLFLLTLENQAKSSPSSKRTRLLNPRVSLYRVKDFKVSTKPVCSQTLPISKNCTCLHLSDKKDLLALGFADGSLLVLSASVSDAAEFSFKSVYLLKNCLHPFPVTGLAFDQEKKILISASADGQVLINSIPETPIKTLSASSFFVVTLSVLVAILVAFIAILFSGKFSLKLNELDDFDAFYNLFPNDLVNNNNEL